MMEIFNEKQIDAIIISDPYNIRHVSGFKGGEGYVYVSDKHKVIITDSRYTEAAQKEAKEGFEVVEHRIGRTYFEIIKELIALEGAHRIGFEDLFMTFSSYQNFLKNCELDSMVPVGDSINRLRSIKTTEEIDKLRTAEDIGDKAFSDILNYIKPGVSELMIAAELEYAMKKHGAEGLGFDTIVASGPNSSLPHAVPGQRIIQSGDFITMDFGCKYDGYCSDMTRTIVVGKANDKQRDIYDTVYKAQTESLKAIKAGVIGCDIHKVAADIIAAAGYGQYFGHGLGHSVGLFIHELPGFSPREKNPIPANTVITVEPGIYVPEFGGVRIEDMILVTENGYENFAHSPKELIEL